MTNKTEKIKIQPHSNWLNIIVNFGVTAIFTVISALFYPYFSAKYNLIQIDSNTNLTILTTKGIIISTIISVVYVIIIVAYNFHHDKNTKIISKPEYEKLESELNVYKKAYNFKNAEVDLLKEIKYFDKNISEYKCKNLQKVLDQIIRQNQNPFLGKIISLPEEQIQYILQEMVHSFSKICDIEKSTVNVTACCKINDDWRWINGCEPHGSIDFVELRKNPSMFTTLESESSNYLFYNDKVEAHNKKLYVYDGEEDDGSIIGRKVIIKDRNNNICISLMYFLSTYNGHHIAETEKNVKNIKNMLSESLFRYIDAKLRVEMILWFINTFSP